jgi:hypothetical protein
MSGRGTDGSTERRKAGPRAARKRGMERWIENVFFGLSEVVVFGLPTLFLLLGAPFNAEVKFAALVGIGTLAVGIGTARGSDSLGWPAMSYRLVPVRIAYHSLTIAIAAGGGAAVDLVAGSALGSLAAAVLASLAAVRLFPELVGALRGLPPWWQWGR